MNPTRLLVVLVLLSLAAWGIARLDRAVPEEEPFAERPPVVTESPLLEGEPRTVRRLRIDHSARPDGQEFGLLELAWEDGAWRMLEPIRDRANAEAVRSLTQRLYGREWQPAPEEWEQRSDAELGLDRPATEVVIGFADGSRQTLEVGATELHGDWSFARRNGERVRLGGAVVRELARSYADFRDPLIIPDSRRVVRIDWTPGEGAAETSVPMRFERAAEAWRLAEPIQARLDVRYHEKVERMLGSRTKPTEVLVRPEQWERMRRGSKLVFHYRGGEAREPLVLWKRGSTIVQEGRPYLLPHTVGDYGFLELPPEELRTKDLVQKAVRDFSSLRLVHEGRHVDFSRKRSGWSAPGARLLPNSGDPGDPAYQDHQVLEELLRRLAALRTVAAEPRPGRPPSGEIWLSISRTPQERGSEILEWWDDGEGNWHIAVRDSSEAVRIDFNLPLQVAQLVRRYGEGEGG